MRIEHLGTEDMWVDVLTKPKQGKAFRKDRAKLMNCALDWQEPGVTASQPRRIASVAMPKAKVLAGGEQRRLQQKVFADISSNKSMPVRAIHA